MFWPTVLQHMNASPVIQEYNFTDYEEYFENGVHILPSLFVLRTLEEYSIYPFIIQPLAIFVPESDPYSGFSAYLRNVTSDESLIFLTITIVAAVMLLSIIRYIERKKILIFQSVADVLNLLINDNQFIKYQRLFLVEVCVIVPLTFAGFIIVNLILSIMQSHLTRPTHQPQINTIEELYRSPFPVFCYTKRSKTDLVAVFRSIANFDNWHDKINITLIPKAYYDRFETFDRSTAYITVSYLIEPALRVQKRYNIRGYHDPHIDLLYAHFASLVGKRFLFFERLNDIIHRIQSAGLYDEWRRRADSNTEKRLLNRNLERVLNSNTNFESTVEFPTFIFYGWIAGTIVLVVEIVWQKLKGRR